MSFDSIKFLLFMIIVFIIYWSINNKYRWILLLVASYYFYMSWDIKGIFLIIFTTILSYSSAILMEKTNKKNKRKLILFLTLVKDFAIKNNIKYHNYNLCKKEYLVMDENDYKDNNHLNGVGAEKFSEKMSNIEKILNDKEAKYKDIFYDTYEEKLENNPDNTLK